jgi:threonine dehydrogenase-like Zn-dependent dehydrogenase
VADTIHAIRRNPPYDGTLSTFYYLPEEFCFKLPPHISFREGALVEPLSIVGHCCRIAETYKVDRWRYSVLCRAAPRPSSLSMR